MMTLEYLRNRWSRGLLHFLEHSQSMILLLNFWTRSSLRYSEVIYWTEHRNVDFSSSKARSVSTNVLVSKLVTSYHRKHFRIQSTLIIVAFPNVCVQRFKLQEDGRNLWGIYHNPNGNESKNCRIGGIVLQGKVGWGRLDDWSSDCRCSQFAMVNTSNTEICEW